MRKRFFDLQLFADGGEGGTGTGTGSAGNGDGGQKVDDRTDFKKASDAFLKENPSFTGQGMKVVSTGRPDGGSGTAHTVNDSINASIRSAFGR